MSFYPRYSSTRQCSLQKYDKVRVIAGRKVPVGVEGEVFWISEPRRYGLSRFEVVTYKIGIRDAKGQAYWTYEKNVTLLEREGKPVVNDGVIIFPQSESLS